MRRRWAQEKTGDDKRGAAKGEREARVQFEPAKNENKCGHSKS
jgi:hypothetical protein